MAKLLSGTRVYGTANVDSVLVVGNITPVVSVSNTTGSLVVTGGVGISGNVYSGNHVITGTGSGITFVDGTIQTTAEMIYSKIAEMLDAPTDSVTQFQPFQ